MPERRLRRFLHLERRRPARADAGAASAQSAARFDGVQRPPPAGGRPGAPTGARLERFGPEPEPAIELVEADASQQPFTRCARCGTDSNVFAVTCAGCGASLDTEAQRAFNERLWAERQAQAARDAAAQAERDAIRVRAEAEAARERRALAEALAREVGDAERRRLRGEGLAGTAWEAARAVADSVIALVRALRRR